MYDIQPARPTGQSRSVTRQTTRSLNTISARTDIKTAEVESAAEVQTSKIDAATAVVQRALQATGYLTTIEAQLSETCPAAMTRLRLLGDTGVMTLQQITFDTASRLRRI